MDTWVWILIAVALVVVALIAWAAMRRQRTQRLQGRFGSEYDHVVEDTGDRRRAESELSAREKRRDELDITPLTPAARDRFAESWRIVQTDFVDDPSAAVGRADRLVVEVMAERGYPTDDFDQRAADVSVDHPDVVTNYRAAREIADRNDGGEATTEELRQAMVHYRALFEELLGTAEGSERVR